MQDEAEPFIRPLGIGSTSLPSCISKRSFDAGKLSILNKNRQKHENIIFINNLNSNHYAYHRCFPTDPQSIY